MTKKKGTEPKKAKKKHCFSCGVVTEPGYLESGHSFKRRNLCDSCLEAMKRRGFCMVADDAFLLESGELVTVPKSKRTDFLQNISERRAKIELRRDSRNRANGVKATGKKASQGKAMPELQHVANDHLGEVRS